MSGPDLSAIRIERVSDEADGAQLWRVWIPPTDPSHRDTDGSDLGPWGNTYWGSLVECISFLADFETIVDDDWRPDYLEWAP